MTRKPPILFLFILLCHCSGLEPREIRVVHLHGSAYNRGFLHGRLLKNEIHVILDQFHAHVKQLYQFPVDSIRSDYLDRVHYQDAIQKLNPSLLDEVRGIADGAEIDFDHIFLLQISEEFLDYLDETRPKRCTSIGVSGDDKTPSIVAQNMDAPYFLHGFPTLLHIKYGSLDLESFVLTSPGLIALNGLNNKGIGVTANGLPGFSHDLTGLPVAFIIRTVLEKTSYKEAVSFLKSVNHAKTQNYLLGGPDETVSLECNGREVYPFRSKENPRITYHTNHYLAHPHILKEIYCSRLETMKEALEKYRYQIGFEEIRSILRSTKWNAGRPISHPFCYASTIMVLGSNPVLFMAPGQPDKYEYEQFDFKKDSLYGGGSG